MGAGNSRDDRGYWAGYVPRLQLLRVAPEHMLRLVVPARAVAACRMMPGDTVFIRDSLSDTYPIILQDSDGEFFLGSGWAKMLGKIDCSVGDHLMLKYKGRSTWKIFVFSASNNAQKFPHRAGVQIDAAYSESSNGTSNAHAQHSPVGFYLPANIPAGAAYPPGAGTMENPIDLDGNSESTDEVEPPDVLDAPMEQYYNATGRIVDNAMKDFFDNISNTFHLRVPLYFFIVGELDFSCDFIALPMDFAKKYVVPILEEDGYPDHVNMYLNGGSESVSIGFRATADGPVVLRRGWAAFLRKHSIIEGASIVLRFEFNIDDVDVHVYDF